MLESFNSYLELEGGELYLEDVSLYELAKTFGTPLYVYSLSYVLDNLRAYKEAFINALICYAVKANPNISLISSLAKEGAGADVVSGGELICALKAGIEPSKIVFAGVGKSEEEIALAVENQILLINAESEEEILKIDSVAKSLNKVQNVAIRVNPDVDPKTHPYIATGLQKSKFGIDIKAIPEIFENSKSLKGIKLAGLHCHIGSQILSVSPFSEALNKVLELYHYLLNKGFELNYLDIGGGLGIKYRPEETAPTPGDLSKELLPALESFKGQLILEPGRSIVGNAGILLTKVLYRKQKSGKHFTVVDAGMNDLIRPSIYSAYHHIVPVRPRNGRKILTSVVGPVCESGDFLALDRELEDLEQGSYLAVLSAGAYGFSMASNYNIRPRPAEVIVHKGKAILSRKRETIEDIFQKVT
ncbi:MAG: diaminopimelate decarboxylase [Aquificaceae bacterium]